MANLNVLYIVPVVAQSKTMSCWAAASAMLLSWKQGIPHTELSAASVAGQNFVQSFKSNIGLSGVEVKELARALKLKAEVPQQYSPKGYYELLKLHGPLWVGTAIFSADSIYRHVRIVDGIFGDETFDGTLVSVIDPDGGRKYTETVLQFAKELEQIARQDLESGSDLNPQTIRFP